MSNSLWPHGLQHTRLLCPPRCPKMCSNSRPLSWWCCLTISSSTAPFSFAFSLSQHQGLVSLLFTSGGQSIGASASAPDLPMNIQGWFSLGLTGLISLLSKELSRVISSTIVQNHQFFSAKRSNQSILKEICSGCSLDGMMLKLKLQYFGHLMWRVDSLEKTLMLGGMGGRRRRGQQRIR